LGQVGMGGTDNPPEHPLHGPEAVKLLSQNAVFQ
jgi:hypothetical protein